MTKIHMKLATAFWCGLAAFSAGALEHGLMRIPDSLAPRREEIVNEVGYPNAVSIPLPGGGSMMLQNEMGGGVMSSPIPVHAVEAVEAFCGKFQKGKSIAAEVSGTTWFACALEEVDFDGQRCSFFHGPIVVKGYCFVLYLRTPADRGLDASVRAVLRQVTLLPPEDGNSEPTIPLVKMDLAKVPPVKDIPEWAEIAEAHKRTVETAAKAEDQPQGHTSAPAAECARMRVPDSLKAILRPETGAIKLPVPGGGHVWVTNYNCGDGTDEYQDVPVPVHAAAARDAANRVVPEDQLILAEISGTTLFAFQEEFDFDHEIDGEPVVSFGGIAIVKGYSFEMEISAPRNRGLDDTVRELLRQITFLPPEDGNAEPPVPVLTNTRAKAPPLKFDDMPGWCQKVKQFTRDPKAPKAVSLPPLPAVVTAPKARAPKNAQSTGREAALVRQSHRAPVAVVREQLRELAGQMGDEAAAAFEAKWSDAMDAPSEKLQDWLTKASPILTELVQTKAAMMTAAAQYDETLEEAKAARTFGAIERAHTLVGQLAAVIGEMNALREQMNVLAERLNELGEMPDPKEEARAARRATDEALQVLKELAAKGDETEAAAEDAPATASDDSGQYYVLVETLRGLPDLRGSSRDDNENLESGHDWRNIDPPFWTITSGYRKQGLCPPDFKNNRDKLYGRGKDKMILEPRRFSYEEDYEVIVEIEHSVRGAQENVITRSVIDRPSRHYLAEWQLPKAIRAVEGGWFELNLAGSLKENTKVDVKKLNYDWIDWERYKPQFNIHCKVVGEPMRQTWKKVFEETVDLYQRGSVKFKCPCVSPKFKVYLKFLDFGGDNTLGMSVEVSYELKTLTEDEATAFAAVEPGVDSLSESEPTAKTPEERAEAIAFHRENIIACEATINRLQEELAKEKDPARRAAIEFALVGERSNIVYEQDRIRAEETGTFTASRTPFDEMCQVQMRENSLREIAEWERDKRLRNRAIELAEKLPGAESVTAERMVAELMDGGFGDTDKWRQLGDAMERKYMGYLERDQAMAESDVADSEESLRRVQTLKSGCDFVLALGGVGGMPRALSLAYQCGSGYLEEGAYGLVKGAVTFYSDAIDVGWSAYEGYKENGWEGAAAEGVKSAFMNYGLPLLASKMNLTREISFGKKTKPEIKKASVSIKPSELNEMEFEMGKATQDISDFVVKRNELSALKRGGTASKDQIAAAEDALARSVARINTSPVAKNMLKHKPEYKAVGAEYDANLQKMITRVQVEMTTEMARRGYGAQKIEQFRNASSAGTVGMDTDLGVVESPDLPFTLNGKTISKYRYQVECQKVLGEKWKQAYGESAERSWMKVTTSVDPEAYMNTEILKFSKEMDNMSGILAKMSRTDLRQAFDVTEFKANEMMRLSREGKLPRLAAMQEVSRGAAKDLKTKALPMLDSEIKRLRAKETALTKQGKALSKTDAHNLKRFEAAREVYGRQIKALSDVGEGKADFTAWDDIIRSATGGRDITEFCKDLGDFMSTIK